MSLPHQNSSFWPVVSNALRDLGRAAVIAANAYAKSVDVEERKQ